MPFPEVPRIIYRKNLLVEVICQLKFPPILRIDSEIPAQYQERIRQEYPLYQEERPELPPQDILHSLSQMGMESLLSTTKAYAFASADGTWVVNLTREFLALTSRKYRRWGDFKKHLKNPLDALQELYVPAFYSRVGLRYQNVIRRSDLSLDNVRWADLVQPCIAGMLHSSDVADSVVQTSGQTVIQLQDGQSQVRVQYGFVQDKKGEICYLIDNDFFTTQQTEVKNAFDILDEFNKRASRLFRWSISDRLHEAMGPESA